MDLLLQLLDVFRHLDTHLAQLVVDHGVWIYAILFAVIFCETGLVVTPFLPGDSLLFAVGALSAMSDGGLSLGIAIPLLLVAAILGDAVNYHVGYWLGPGFLEKKLEGGQVGGWISRLIKREHLERTQRFYEKYGGKTIILARFVPIVRTFAPFVAGVGKMDYRRFLVFNAVGAVAWVVICTMAGHFFGQHPFVKKNFEIVVLGIIFVSVLPIVFEVGKAQLEQRRSTQV